MQIAYLALFVLFAGSCAPAAAPPPSPSRGTEPLPSHLAIVSQSPKPNLGTVILTGIPHIQQKPDFCGEACVAMALAKLGHPLSQDDVFARTGLGPELGRGAYTAELKAAMESLGFDPGPVWRQIQANRAEEELTADLSAIVQDLQNGIPSIVCMHYSESPSTTEHFRLIVGYDADADEVVYHEPAEADAGYRRMKRQKFFSLWPLAYQKDTWTLIRLRLSPRDLSLAKAEPHTGFSKADFAQKVMEVKEQTSRLPGHFTILVEPPFVVAGDNVEATVRSQSDNTVRWATRMLKQDYFTKDPSRILVVWLFKDNTSYRRNAIELFHDPPETPYGYYSSKHGALVMNIGTGGGTLVHEIVHPFMEANFPDCPPWLNEGMGSLYEQCGDKDGHIYGYTNWRLRGLKEAIREGSVPAFQSLLAMNEDQFYDDDSAMHYAASRYLLYYLQEKGLLVQYYQAFLANREKDPTGYQTLVSVLGESDMAAFKKRWEAFVMGLRFP